MTKMLAAFLICFGLVSFGIQAFRQLSNKDKWNLSKVLAYSAACAIVTVAILFSIVILF